jgi:penicillin V acylase-like amidase (Ntn superfamily)
VQVPFILSYYPAGSKIESQTPDGSQGLTFHTKFPILSAGVQAIPDAKQPAYIDATNDQGLTISLNSFNGSSAPVVNNDASKILSAADMALWVAGNFSNVAEVKAALLSSDIEFWLPSPAVLGNLPFPIHYAIFDKTGVGIVLEFQDGKKNVYDNPVNVLTNGPEFPWHLTNLNNYTFTNLDKNSSQIGNLKLRTQDAGIALTSLPGSETSSGRFVKAAYYANYVRKASSPDEAIVTLSHIMNNFDRPYDLTIDAAGDGGDGPGLETVSSEVTYWTVLNDLSRNLFYFRNIKSLNYSVIDFNKLKSVDKVKNVSIYIDELNRINDPFNALYN